MHANLFIELSVILAIAGVVSTIMKLLRQPLIIGHIFTGLLLGPYVLNIVGKPEALSDFSTFGIALLLFIIGLGLNPRVIKEVGKASVIIGLGQILFTASIGFAIARILSFDTISALYIAIALTFSSTIIILKLLSDKKETTQLYAKVATGMLLVQDIAATIVLIVAAGSQEGGVSLPELSMTAGFIILLVVGLVLLSVKVLPKLSTFIGDSQEYLFLFSVAWGFGVASLFSVAGLSIEVGALFAGVALATQPYAAEVSSRLRPLRDFFIVLFFIVIGVELEFANFLGVLVPAIVFSLFVLLGNPLIVMTIMGLLSYTKKASFKTALTVAQISEFSLIFVLLGLEAGQISQEVVSIVTLTGLITIAGSTYMMLYDEKLYDIFEHHLRLFERRKIKYGQKAAKHGADIILFGYARGGHEFVRQFDRMSKPYLIVDYDPEAIDLLENNDLPHAYGDVTDVEFLDEINVEKAKLVISTVTSFNTNLFLTTHVHANNKDAIIIPHSENPEEAAILYEHGATYVMMPHYIGSERISSMINRVGLKKSDFTASREKHLRYVQQHLI